MRKIASNIKMYVQESEGALGFRKARDMNKAFLMKHASGYQNEDFKQFHMNLLEI